MYQGFCRYPTEGAQTWDLKSLFWEQIPESRSKDPDELRFPLE